MLLDFFHDLLQTLFEITAIAGSGQQKAHIERENGCSGQDGRYFAAGDFKRQTFGNCRFADTRLAHQQRIVLLAAAEHLDRALDLGLAANQRIDFALARLFVKIDAIGVERLALLFRAIGLFAALPALIGTFRIGFALGGCAGHSGTLCDAMGDIIDRIIAGHILFLQEIGGVAFALGKESDQNIGTRYLFPSRRLDMDDGALDDPLEARRRLGIYRNGCHKAHQFGVDILNEAMAENIEIDPASAHDGNRIAVVD